jgi:hypothetical protein
VFIQKHSHKSGDAHQFTLVYKFFSPITQYHYIILAEYHDEDFFAIKFYCKKDKRSDYKFNKIVNKGDVSNILITCLKVVPLLLSAYPHSSFGFTASRTIDFKSKTTEDLNKNQRYKVYSRLVENTIGNAYFAHYAYEDISAYLLVNRMHDIAEKESQIKNMIRACYINVPDII